MELLWPTRNPYVTQHYGAKSPRYATYHKGVDLRVINDPKRDIICALEGEVILVSDTTRNSWYTNGQTNEYYGKGSPFGQHVKVKCTIEEETYFMLYAHLEEIKVKEGDVIKAGEIIGKGGETGNSSGAHLHFELRQEEDTSQKAINPFPYFVSAFKSAIPEWGKNAWAWGMENGIFTDESYFDDTLTKGEMAVLMHRLYTLMKSQ